MTTKKPKTPPTDEQIQDSVRLRELFEKRAGMSQLEFGQAYGIGNQGMVWQYLNTDKPKGSVLNVVAAIKFAEGLRCRVSDFSPSLQKEIDRIATFASDHQHTVSIEPTQVQQTRTDDRNSNIAPSSSGTPWPFLFVTPKQWATLSERQQGRAEGVIEEMLHNKNHADKNVSRTAKIA